VGSKSNALDENLSLCKTEMWVVPASSSNAM
jgi:hypothetical protein